MVTWRPVRRPIGIARIRPSKQLPLHHPYIKPLACQPSILPLSRSIAAHSSSSLHPDIIHIYHPAHQYQSICKPVRQLFVAPPKFTTLRTCIDSTSKQSKQAFHVLDCLFPSQLILAVSLSSCPASGQQQTNKSLTSPPTRHSFIAAIMAHTATHQDSPHEVSKRPKGNSTISIQRHTATSTYTLISQESSKTHTPTSKHLPTPA